MARTLRWRLPMTYALAQVLTGVEIGVLVAWLFLGPGLSLPAALALGLPLGLPLVAAQMAGLLWLTTDAPEDSRTPVMGGG